jgi:hypothetical protein
MVILKWILKTLVLFLDLIFFTATLGKAGFFEKLMRLFCIKVINISKNFALEIF